MMSPDGIRSWGYALQILGGGVVLLVILGMIPRLFGVKFRTPHWRCGRSGFTISADLREGQLLSNREPTCRTLRRQNPEQLF